MTSLVHAMFLLKALITALTHHLRSIGRARDPAAGQPTEVLYCQTFGRRVGQAQKLFHFGPRADWALNYMNRSH